jgi:hypothetical protein
MRPRSFEHGNVPFNLAVLYGIPLVRANIPLFATLARQCG